MTKTYHPSCDRLGVCQGLGPQQCPDCDSWECEVPCAPKMLRLDCDEDWDGDKPCAAEPPTPTRPVAQYPFAPGVIQRAPSSSYTDTDGVWLPLSLAGTLKLLCVIAALGLLAGYLVERFA